MWFKKIYSDILIDTVRRITGGLIDDEQGGFRKGRGCVNQVFTLKHIGVRKHEREETQGVCGFYRFGKGIR